MAVVNVRIDDHVHEALKDRAEADGVSLSEFVRTLLLEATLPVKPPEDRGSGHGDLAAPDSLPTRDRLVLSMLHRILARVLPKDSNDVDGDLEYQLMKAEILESGFTGEYWLEVAGFETELSKRDSRRVQDILQMFRIITFSLDRIAKDGGVVPPKLVSSLTFRGFDHNDSLEGHMARYVRFMMKDGDAWTELAPQIEANDNGNSHMQMLDIYMRMLSEYRRIMDARDRFASFDSYYLSLEELERVASAQVHPSHRS